MDVIQAARELGKALQADDRFIRVQLAQQKSDEDQELQAAIAVFNKKRTELNTEVQKDNKDQAKIQEMDAQLKSMYQDIFQNENMSNYSLVREEFQDVMNFVNQIISGSANGQDPDTIEYEDASSCGGDCGGCSGCS